MANPLVKVFGAILGFFKSGKAQKDAEVALEYAVKALPYIKIAGDIITGVTPTGVDDILWNVVKNKYPKLFDGSIHTSDELKAYALGAASSMLQAKYPKLTTTVAVLATQIAYVDAKANGAIPASPSAPSTDGLILNVQPPTKSPLSL
jgi:hypothetical protein